MGQPERTDLELIAGCLKGQPSAQKGLYMRYGSFTFGICRRYSADAMEAEDLHQIGWIRTFDRLATFNQQGPLGAWLRTLFVRVCLSAWEKKKSRMQWLQTTHEEAGLEVPDLKAPSDFLEMERLVKAMSALPEGPRLVLNLYAIEGMNHNEIATELGISEETSRQQLRQARIRIAKQLQISLKTPQSQPTPNQ